MLKTGNKVSSLTIILITKQVIGEIVGLLVTNWQGRNVFVFTDTWHLFLFFFNHVWGIFLMFINFITKLAAVECIIN